MVKQDDENRAVDNDSYEVTVKSDSAKKDAPSLGAFDTDKDVDSLSNPEDIIKELDRVESIDTGPLARKSIASQKVQKESASEDESAAERDDESEPAAMTKPVDLSESPAMDKRAVNTAGNVLSATPVSSSHRSFQKQHQKRRIVQVFLLLFVLLTIGASAAAVYFYTESTSGKDKVATLEDELSRLNAQNDTLLAQVGDQALLNDETKIAIPELSVQYAPSETTSEIVYGYGGTSADGVAYLHVTTRTLADYQESVDGAARFTCGIGSAAPVTIVRGTKEQIAALGDSRSLIEVREIGSLQYAVTAPAEPCSSTQTEAIREAQTAAGALFASFEAIDEEVADADSTPAEDVVAPRVGSQDVPQNP